MAEAAGRVRRLGSSLGIIIPSETAKEEKLQEGDEVFVEIRKKKTIRELFGSARGLKIDSQKMKDETRKEWSRW